MTQWNSSYYRRKNYSRALRDPAESIINDGLFLPVEPPVLSALIRSNLFSSGYNDEIRDFIAVSPALTYNFLNIAHSPFIKEKRAIASLNDVLETLGNDFSLTLLRNFVYRSCKMQNSSGIHPYVDENFYVSIKAAHLSVLLADEIAYSSHFSTYAGAILHNIGAVALALRFPVQYSRLVSSDSLDFNGHVLSEETAFGINHCYLGARMIEGWGSFPFIPDAVFYHHHSLSKIKNANSLVKLICFTSMIESSDEECRLRYLEAGKELFGFTPNQIDEFISIAELKAQGRLMKLGIEPMMGKGEPFYQPKDGLDVMHLHDAGEKSLVSVITEKLKKTENLNDRLRGIGHAIYTLTGINKVLYFSCNGDSKILEGVSLIEPENLSLKNDLSIHVDNKESLVVISFMTGLEINSLDRVDKTEPGLFDLQISNYMESDGLYAIPVTSMGKARGVIVIGVNNHGNITNAEALQRIRVIVKPLLPIITEEEINNSSGVSSVNSAGSNPIEMRKLIHEINNPLSAIKNFLKVLNMKLDDINVESNEIKIIDDELNRISKLLKEFKSSSHEEKKEKSTSGIKDIISDTVMLIKNSRVSGPEVNIGFQADENIPEIMIDKDAFRQVLINLINNAIEAMPEGGNINVTLRYIPGPKVFDAKVVSQDNDRKRIEISIADNGPGIPEHLRAGIFRKQSTTKADHDGLGLLIVYELVKRMGGTITLDNKGSSGACFTITMPVS